MFVETRNTEWLNLNGQRNYPLAESVPARDTSGSVQLPTDFIVDLQLSVHATGTISIDKFHLLTVSVFSTGAVVEIGYDGELAGTAVIDKNTFARNTSYRIVFTGTFKDADGLITIGSMQAVSEVMPGVVTFDIAGARIEHTVIKRALKGVSGIYVRSLTELSDLHQNDIVLKAGSNVTFSTSILGDTTTIVINAIPGEGEQPPSKNKDDCGNVINPLLTINGLLPDASGNFALLGDNCVEFESSEAEVIMNNECSQPCCGCDDLQIIEDELARVRSMVDDMNIESGRLAAEVQSIAINLVSSKTDGAPTEVTRMIAIMRALLDNAEVATDCLPPCPIPAPGDTLELEDGDGFELEDGDELEL